MYNDPLSNLPPETQQRVQDALQSFAHGGFQGMTPAFVTQFTNAPQQQTHTPQAWAHWEYGADEWALFDKIDWEATRRKSQLTTSIGSVMFLLVIGVLLFVVLTLIQPFNPATLVLVIVPAILLLTALIFLIGPASYSTSEAKKRYEARQNLTEPHKVTFSEKGVWEAGTYFGLNELFLKLKSVKLTAQPATLHFTITTSSLGRNSSGHVDTIHVLVPRYHEEEAAQLAQRYYSEVIDTSKKPYNPREPV
jgi:hypothetical protein